MNIWMKTSSLKQRRLRDSFTNSSLTSIRTPLPVILQTEDNQRLGSNSSLAFESQEQSQEGKCKPNKQAINPVPQVAQKQPQQYRSTNSSILDNSGHPSTHWRNSLNSFSSLHLRNNSSNHNTSSNENKMIQDSKKVTGSHVNSKRLLTTGRQHDRREHIVSIIEYCSNEVGMACYNLNTGEIKLAQIIERMTYIKTISTLERFYPQEIIFSCTLEDTLLMKKLMAIFRRTSFKPVKRTLFDETKGYYIYTLRGNKNEHNPDHKFLSYAALHALLATMESTFEFTLTYSALNIKWHYLEEVLVIDSQTIADLEIFINKETKIAKNTFIDNFKCLTDGGTRMLRANILQPLTDTKALRCRFALVEVLLQPQNKGILDLLAKELVKFRNYEPITAKFIQSPKCDNIRSIKSYLNGILLLSRMCFQLQHLQKKVASFLDSNQVSQEARDEGSIMKTLFSKLKDQRIAAIRKIIEENFDPEVLKNYENNQGPNGRENKKKSMGVINNKNRRDNFIFLFKLEKITDEFAEISRLTYSHTIEDILNKFQEIKGKFAHENAVKLLYNQYRGYYISAKATNAKPIDLSQISGILEDDIILISNKGKVTTFSTGTLLSLNNRLRQNEHKLIYQSTELLLETIKSIQKNMEILFDLSYWISMLDMIIAFATFVRLYQTTHHVVFARPLFIDSEQGGVVKIEKLRTIWTMEKLHKLSTDISLTLDKGVSALAVHKQLNSFDQLNIIYSFGFLTILAQIGCLVPAHSYSTYIYDTLISKMEVEGNLENKLSHFQTQLLSLKNILDNVAHKDPRDKRPQLLSKCLVLIDQVCKGTKPEQEYAISMAAMQDLAGEGPLRTKNISIVLVSDRTLFDMLGDFKSVTLCEFSPTGQEHAKMDELMLRKEKELLECLRKYNFDASFEEIYRKIPAVSG